MISPSLAETPIPPDLPFRAKSAAVTAFKVLTHAHIGDCKPADCWTLNTRKREHAKPWEMGI